MSARSPFWLVLLKSWCANREGLTLPFIVGADAIRRNADIRPEDTRNIFAEICSHNVPNSVICIRPCADMRVPILSIHNLPTTGIQVLLDDRWGANDAEKLNNLAEDAKNLTLAGRFSRIGYPGEYRWAPFQPEELTFIQSVIRKHSVIPTSGG